MKTMSYHCMGGLAAWSILMAGMASAGTPPTTWQLLVGASSVSQSEESPGEESQDPKALCIELMDRARQAMKEGNLETAESLVERAESLKVNFSVFHYGDTPKRVRRELEKRKKARGGDQRAAAPERRSSQDPFRGRDEADRGAAEEGGNAFPNESPFGTETELAPPAEDAAEGMPADEATVDEQGDSRRMQSDRLLLKARKGLAVGDIRKASEYAAQSKALRVAYEFREDSPDKVQAAIQRQQEISKRPASQRESESYRRDLANSLMQQAEALMQWNELDEAERLVGDAQRLNVTYGPFDQQPATLLQQIASARNPSENGLEPLPPVGGRGRANAESEQPNGDHPNKAEALDLVRQAREALDAGDIRQAEALAREAENLRVPDQAFGENEDRPWLVLLQIQKTRKRGVVQASGAEPIDSDDRDADSRYDGRQAVYDREHDDTRNVPAATEESDPLSEGMRLFQEGQEALRHRDTETALERFRAANEHVDDLDPNTQQRLQDNLTFLARQGDRPPAPPRDGSLLNEAAASQQLRARQISADLARRESDARRMSEVDPKRALKLLEQARADVENAGLDSASRDVLVKRVNRGIEELQAYIEANAPQLELDDRNRATEQEIDRERVHKVEVQEKLALLVNEFNKLMEERRFAEAEVIAKQASELAPREAVVLQLKHQAKFARSVYNDMAVRDAKADGFAAAMSSADQSSIPFDDRVPITFGDPKHWADITKSRGDRKRDGRLNRTESEIEIEQKLKTPVSLKFQEQPLSAVLDNLAKLAQVPLYVDPRGLAEEGVISETPVTIDLGQEISLKSALNLILEPLNLSYVIKNEVLNITSKQMRDGELYTNTYYVADLVIPIPNFVPSAKDGLGGPFNDAVGGANWGGMQTPLNVMAGNNANGQVNPNTLAQVGAGSMSSLTPNGMPGGSMGPGPGGLGGGVEPDFDSLIDLITSTIQPTTWDEVGGPSSIKEYAGNLSLVISTTQEVHQDVADLLEQLRRLQDLQVTIEVRFITLNDNFFERIGIDFDFDINDNVDRKFQIFGTRQNTNRIFTALPTANRGPIRDVQDRDLGHGGSVTVGLQTPGVFSADLDIPVSQGSFPLAVPQFGGFQPGAGAQLGFAILSDIETFFFIEASQGDRRSNVLQAPKVTLFNGQSASVQDISISPFVVSVIPVVGDFAAAQMPVIAAVREGSHLTVQAVISNDRRFVRLTVVPYFSRIGQVNTFTFTGSSSSTEDSGSEGDTDKTTKRNVRRQETREGTTVQQPTIAIFSVTSTVSVPDGGTVLLGGIKRLSEGRNEFGTPILNKIPYLNRLFKNVGIGRETQSLMMMVTPRIIIQEEEEELLTGQSASP